MNIENNAQNNIEINIQMEIFELDTQRLTDKLISAAKEVENKVVVDLDNSPSESAIRQVRDDLRLTQNSTPNSDDEYLSESSSIKKKKAEKSVPKVSNPMKRPNVVNGAYRMTKRRREILSNVQGANTQERNEKKAKIEGKWTNDSKKRKMRSLQLKRPQPTIQLDNVNDPKLHKNLDKRLEIKVKPKESEDTVEVRELKERIAQLERKEEDQLHIAGLRDKINEQGNVIMRLRKEANALPARHAQPVKKKPQADAEVQWAVDQADKGMQVDMQPEVEQMQSEQPQAESEQPQAESEQQPEAQVKMVDKEVQCEKHPRVQMDGGNPSYHHCTITHHITTTIKVV